MSKKFIVMPGSIYSSLDAFTNLCENTQGVLFYKTYKTSKGNLFIASYYVTGTGEQQNALRKDVVEKFLSIKKEYKTLNFQTHTIETFKKHYKDYESFVDTLDSQLIFAPKQTVKLLGKEDSADPYSFFIDDNLMLQIENWNLSKTNNWKKHYNKINDFLAETEAVILL
ncbi:Uncharacterised protein [Candidatus Tiddalikarchaeum anstoanum]|nr:Uncharacterised protein [Candidatus Tiddalikarchaeum anstoanum]